MRVVPWGCSTIEMVDPLPGFPGQRTYRLDPLDRRGDLWSMRAVSAPQLHFLLAAPDVFFPSYAPQLDERAAAVLDLATADQAVVLVMVAVGPSLATTTANLLAPVVINPVGRRAAQVVIDDVDLPLAAPLVA